MTPVVAWTGLALLEEAESSAIVVIALAVSGEVVPVVGIVALLIEVVALVILLVPVLAGWAVQRNILPLAGSGVEPLAIVNGVVQVSREMASA